MEPASTTPPDRVAPPRMLATRLAAGAVAALAAALLLGAASPALLDPRALAALAAGAGAAALAVAAAARRRGDAHRLRIATESAQRVRATEAAAVGARELRRVLDVLPVRVARYDREFRFRYANRLHRRFFGLDEHRELRGVPLAELVGREAFEFVRPYFTQALAGTPTSYQRVVQVPSGERWVQVWLMPDFDLADEEIGGVLAASVDITERRLAEQRAIHARAQLRDALQSIEDGFVLFDADDRLVACNERYVEFYPDSRDVVRPGVRFEDIVRDGARRGRIAGVAGREEAWIAERLAQHRAADGSREQELADGRWLRVSEKRTADGGTVGLYVDITELKHANQRVEAGLRMLANTVEHLPMGVSVVDGDLRVAAFNAAFLKLHDLEEVGVRPGDRLDRIYRTLALRGDYGPGDPDALVAARMALAQEGHAHRFERARPDGRVLEVFRSPFPGGGFVTLYTDVTERKATERRIVEAREHAEAAARTKSEFIAALSRDVRAPLDGVLGLADLLLQSRLAPTQRRHVEWLQGSARTLLATLSNLLEHTSPAEAAIAHAPAVALPARSHARVLVVEDDPVTREITRALLGRDGIEVDEAPDGPAALSRCAERRYDLVLMDIELPALDGIATTRALRALDAAGAPRTPVIALTASTRAGTRSACLAGGMDGFVVKPVEPRTLLATIAPFLPADVRLRAAPQDGAPAVDPAVFDALGELMGDGLGELVATYAASARAHVAALRGALEGTDAAALLRPAHTLKSSSANLGATTLTGLAGQVEALARAGRRDGAAALVDDLDAALERVCEEIGAPPARVAETVDGSR